MAREPAPYLRRMPAPGAALLAGAVGLFSMAASADEGELTTIRIEGGQWLDTDSPFEPEAPRATDPAPGSRAVVEAETLEETGTDRVEALTGHLPGAHAGREQGGLGTSVTMRGFAVTRPVKDGLPDIERLFVRDLHTVERVELLSGPDAILTGVASPGGVIRYTGKRPEFDAARTVGIEAGAPDHRRLTLDSTGPLGERVAYRAVAATQDGETDPGELRDRRDHAQVGLTWLYSDHGELFLEHEYQRNQKPYDMGTIITDDGPRYDTIYHSPDQYSDRRYERTALELTHELGSRWQVRASAAHAEVERDEFLFGFSSGGELPAPDPLDVYAAAIEDTYTQDDARLEVTHRVTGRDGVHTTVLGADYQERVIDFEREPGFCSQLLLDWDLCTSQLLATEDPDFDSIDLDALYTWEQVRPEETRNEGVYLAHRSEVGGSWRITAGVRHNTYEQSSAGTAEADLETDSEGSDTTWQAGSTVRAGEHLEHFGSIGTTVQPNSGRDRHGDLLPNREATQAEFGMRVFPDPRQRWEFLYFLTDVTNVARPDDGCDADCLAEVGEQMVYTVDGRLEVRGLETRYDLAAGGWRLHLNYGIQRSRVADDGTEQEGKQFRGIPEYTGGSRLAREWERGGDTARLWWATEYVGSRYVDGDNEFSVPSYLRHDLGATYRWGDGTRLHLAIRNATDERYIRAPNVQGSRRALRLGMNKEF